MKGRERGLVLVGLLSLLAVYLASQTAPPSKVDFEAIAKKLVNQCAAVREGELVLISGGTKNLELLEDIAVNVSKVGGHPFLTFGSDRLTRRMWTDVPTKYDTQSREPWVKLAGLFAAQIAVSYGEDEGLLADIPPERLSASGQADAVINETLRKNNFRVINLGNGLYPTVQLAKRYGMTIDELSRLFWDCVNVDYAEMQKTCSTVKGVLGSGKEVRITKPNGTDLTVRIEGRPVLISDGMISEEDLKAGYAACQVYLPAGEVFIAPIAGTAEGKVVVDRDFFGGQEVTGLTMIFKAGKMTSMSAKSGFERLKALYDAAGPGKDDFALIDIGVNPKLAEGAGARILNYVRAGMVTVGIGNNVWAGGTNTSTYGLQTYLTDCTLSVDGKVLVESGKLIR